MYHTYCIFRPSHSNFGTPNLAMDTTGYSSCGGPFLQAIEQSIGLLEDATFGLEVAGVVQGFQGELDLQLDLIGWNLKC